MTSAPFAPPGRPVQAARFYLARVTPSVARRLLAARRPGAAEKPDAVQALGSAMRDRRWTFSGAPIVLSPEGILLDGVQRLAAVILADAAIDVVVAENVVEAAMHGAGQESRRALSRVLAASGIPVPTAVQQALIRLIHYDDGVLGQSAPPPVPWGRQLRILAANPALQVVAAAAAARRGRALPLPILIQLTFMGYAVSASLTDRLRDAVLNPGNYASDDPGVLLSQEMERERVGASARASPIRLLALGILALNALITGVPLDRHSWTRRVDEEPDAPFPRLKGYAGLQFPTAEPARSWMAENPPQARDLTVTLETIHPTQAESYLRQADEARRHRGAYVNAIARDIAAGRWMIDVQPICFSRSGRLMDGQHRLRAVLAANGPIEVPVLRGLPEVDPVLPGRTVLPRPALPSTLQDFGDSALVSAAANLMWRYERRPASSQRAKATTAEISEIIEVHPRLAELRTYARRLVDYCRPSVMIYAAYVIERENPQAGRAFLDAFEAGSDATPRSPIGALRRQMARLRRTKASKEALLEALLKGWVRYRARKRP